MKNIHLLSTDKPSKKGDIVVWNGLKIWDGVGEPPHHNQNIYITSDEDIKEGDWCIDEDGLKKCTAHAGTMNHYFQKIILTTDQDLIKDGVQAIDDEFLEWFVKNPNCEEVKIDDLTDYNYEPNYKFYGIIIPKEEPKQETLEEAAERISKSHSVHETGQDDVYQGVIQGAKWQAERMYSDEEVIDIIQDFTSESRTRIREWFKEFKKK